MNYKVKAGDTLAKIAKQNGLTLAELLEANPNFKNKPGNVNVGEIVNVPNGMSTADTRPLPSAMLKEALMPGTAGKELGGLSAKYETGGRGPGTVSTGVGDPGGVSYGSYQMATKTGTAGRFVSQPDFPWRLEFQGLQPGMQAFTAKWKAIATTEPIAFQAAQHEFIKKTHFDLLVGKVRNDDGLDVTTRSRTLQDVVWSTAVQHGGNTSIVHLALATVEVDQTHPDFDRKLISAVYAERGRKKPDGNLAYFSKSSPGVQSGVAKRFKNEEIDALAMLTNEV
jgi:LysM repeat protein